ncbi:FKBP-type peptidyl-prolyl cis-trans isomerase [Parafrankia elaeagni]|uniref:FKBP-type peptidyl-prolyl cis-trans isomerase n=1 Tax=Parafrankia elaeagni TaxID=222534 RepID=UPI00036EFB54|nr:FKBP-type peptidyl-prolyl cis-trans isomerase [Parafrankia elaeagni]
MTCISHGVTARHRRRLVGLVLPAVLLVPLAACSSSVAPDGTAAAPVPSAAAQASQVGTPPAVQNATDLTRKPIAAAGNGLAPPTLVTQDLVTGDGAEASDTSTVTIQYVGTIWKSGEQFDASWDRGAPDSFPLLNTIPGFGQGISGMKEGGRRLIVIPPELGYGPEGGQPPLILADDSLVFVVDLLEVGGGQSDDGQSDDGQSDDGQSGGEAGGGDGAAGGAESPAGSL